jgi:hypothetical protein
VVYLAFLLFIAANSSWFRYSSKPCHHNYRRRSGWYLLVGLLVMFHSVLVGIVLRDDDAMVDSAVLSIT